MEVKDRIKELRRVRASDLVANTKNWRRHPQWQKDGMQAVLEQIGYAGALIAYERGDELVLIDGHLRQEMTPEEEVPVLILDVSDEEADILLASYDPLTSMASEDGVALKVIIDGLKTENDALAALMQDIQERWSQDDLLTVDNFTDAYYLDNPLEKHNPVTPTDEHGVFYKGFLVHLSEADNAEVTEAMFRLGERWELDTMADVLLRLVRETAGEVESA